MRSIFIVTPQLHCFHDFPTVTDSSLWCCRLLSAHEACLSIMHACEDTSRCLPAHLCSLYMHVHMPWYLTACEYDCMCSVCIHVCYETEEVKHKDGSGLTSTDLSVKMLRWFQIWLAIHKHIHAHMNTSMQANLINLDWNEAEIRVCNQVVETV